MKPNRKLIALGDEARQKLLNGAQIAEEAVGSTLGPKGSIVAIDRQYGVPLTIRDGVSVARELVPLKDEFENMGAQLIIGAAEKTNDAAGDGTTVTTILANALVQESFRNITAGTNQMHIRKGIQKAVESIVLILKGMAKPIKKTGEIEQVATISAQDSHIGSLIAEAMDKVGKKGVITVEEGGGYDVEIEYKDGLEFRKGFLSPYFVTDQQSGEAKVENPYILVTDKKLDSPQEFFPFMEKWAENTEKKSKNIVVIAGSIQGESLAFLVVNKVKGNLGAIAVQAPYHGDRQADVLQDIAVLTGATFVSADSGMNLEEVELEHLGRAKTVVASKDSTVIMDGQGDKKMVDLRVEFLKHQLEKRELSSFDKENIEERLAKLTSGVAVLLVGAYSEAEMKERKELCIDAINAAKAAVDEGIVPGGEIALLEASKVLDGVVVDYKDEKIGVEIVKKACEAPFRRLMHNAGFDPGQMLERVLGAKIGQGIDVTDGKIKDMVKSGIIDPVKVVRRALENAASTASVMMSTSVLISEDDKRPDS